MKKFLIPILATLAFTLSACDNKRGTNDNAGGEKGDISGGGAAGGPGTSTNTADGTGRGGR